MNRKNAKWLCKILNILNNSATEYRIKNKCRKNNEHPGTIQLAPDCPRGQYQRLKRKLTRRTLEL